MSTVSLLFSSLPHVAVIPILIGPLQVLLAILPAILAAIGSVLLAMLKPSAIKAGAKVIWRNKFAFAVIAALIAGAVYGLKHLPGKRTAGGVAAIGTAEWPMFRGSLSRRGGGVDGAADPVSGGTVWKFDARFKTYYSSPAVVGNLVLASAAAKEVFSDHGAIFCLDAQTGGLVWEYSPDDFRATFSSPTVAGKVVVCGEGTHLIRDARIICLSRETGRKLWDYRTGSHVESSPCVADGKAYCGAGADGLYGFTLDVPAGASNLLWHVRGSSDGKWRYHCDASPAVIDGRVYFSSAVVHPGDWNGIVCVDANTGKKVWHTEAPYPVWGPPSIVSNRLFIGMGNGNFVESAEQVWGRRQEELKKQGATAAQIVEEGKKAAAGGELWAMDRTTGKVLWTRPLRQTLLGAIAEADGQLYYAARDGRFTCLTLDGELVWDLDLKEGVVTSPAIGKDNVYIVTESGRLCAVNRKTHRIIWETRPGAGDPFMSSPAIGCGHVYVGTPQDGLVCLGTPSEPQAVVWAGSLGGPGQSGWTAGSTVPTRGMFAARWPADAEQTNVPALSGPPACADGLLLVTTDSPGRRGLTALGMGSVEARSSSRNKLEERWFHASAQPPHGSAAAGGGRAYFADGEPGQGGRRLYAVDLRDGSSSWNLPIEPAASGEFLLTPQCLYVFAAAGTLCGVGLTNADAGKILWSVPVGKTVGSPVVANDILLAATLSPTAIVALSRADRAILWQCALPAPPISGVVASPDVAVAATAKGLTALSLVNGGVLWTLPCSPTSTPVVIDENRIACATADGDLVIADWRGREPLRIKGTTAGFPPMLCGDRLLYARDGAIRKLEWSSKTDTLWCKTDWLGPMTTAPILVDGRLYFGTATKGLVCMQAGK